MSKKEKRQNLKVIQHDLVKKVFVRYPGLSLVDFFFENEVLYDPIPQGI